jgi:hypothetical protein
VDHVGLPAGSYEVPLGESSDDSRAENQVGPQ